MNRRPASAVLFTVFMFTVLIWGSSWLFIKITLDRGMTPVWGTAVRFISAAVFMLLFALPRLRKHPPQRRHFRLIAYHGLFMVAASNILVFWGQQFIASSLSSILFAVFPLMVALFSHFMLQTETLTAPKFIGIIVGFSGVFMIFFDPAKMSGSSSVITGMAAIVLSVAFTTWPTVMIKRDGSDMDPVILNAAGIILGAAVLTVTALITEGPLPQTTMDTKVLASLVYLGVLGSGFTFVAYFWLMKFVDITRLSLSAYLTPIVTVLASWFFYGEPVVPRNILAMLVIFSGIFIFDHAANTRLIRKVLKQ